MNENRHWRVVQTVELAANSKEVWNTVGGFFTIHLWHPDIEITEIPEDQTSASAIRRILTFPGQPKTTEELLHLDNENLHYSYKWHAGAWGEKVQNYCASIRVIDTYMSERCIMQWSSSFEYSEDAVSDFYWRGFAELQRLFPTNK